MVILEKNQITYKVNVIISIKKVLNKYALIINLLCLN